MFLLPTILWCLNVASICSQFVILVIKSVDLGTALQRLCVARPNRSGVALNTLSIEHLLLAGVGGRRDADFLLLLHRYRRIDGPR